jgi:predicted secreted acid phosphatase
VKTIFAMIAFLLSGGADNAFAAAPPPVSPDEIVAYHDSGQWDADIDRVIGRARRFVKARAKHVRRPAIVLDIDDTSLSSYDCLKPFDFDRSAVDCAARGDLPAIAQTRRLYRFVRRRHIAVFFITGRRARIRRTTIANLHRAGYAGRLRVHMRPNRQRPGTYDGWKARTRRSIIAKGYRIVANVGDQRSDLDGGAALRAFKLPNPMYVIPSA